MSVIEIYQPMAEGMGYESSIPKGAQEAEHPRPVWTTGAYEEETTRLIATPTPPGDVGHRYNNPPARGGVARSIPGNSR